MKEEGYVDTNNQTVDSTNSVEIPAEPTVVPNEQPVASVIQEVPVQAVEPVNNTVSNEDETVTKTKTTFRILLIISLVLGIISSVINYQNINKVTSFAFIETELSLNKLFFGLGIAATVLSVINIYIVDNKTKIAGFLGIIIGVCAFFSYLGIFGFIAAALLIIDGIRLLIKG